MDYVNRAIAPQLCGEESPNSKGQDTLRKQGYYERKLIVTESATENIPSASGG